MIAAPSARTLGMIRWTSPGGSFTSSGWRGLLVSGSTQALMIGARARCFCRIGRWSPPTVPSAEMVRPTFQMRRPFRSLIPILASFFGLRADGSEGGHPGGWPPSLLSAAGVEATGDDARRWQNWGAASDAYRRVAVRAALFFVAFTYVFLLEKAKYLNHLYLFSLIAFLMISVSAHRSASLDAWLRPRNRSETAPAWALWPLRAQMGLLAEALDPAAHDAAAVLLTPDTAVVAGLPL